MKSEAINGELKKPSYSTWRALSLTGVYLLMGIHMLHWKLAGRTLAPLELNEVLYTLHLGIITAGFIFMGLTLLFTLVLGRFFCGWLCHILALQDFSEYLLKKVNIKPAPVRSRSLYAVPFIAMGYLFILPQIEILFLGKPAPEWRMQTDAEGWASFITNDFWRNLPGAGITLSTFFVCGFLIIYFLGSRSFCQYVCPYGAIFALSDRLAPGKIKLTGSCNQCGLCTEVCSSHILVHKEVLHFGKVVDHNCLKDLDCVQVCPNQALQYGFSTPSLGASLRNTVGAEKKFNFTLKEDLVLLLLFALFTGIYFGLYDTIPFLLAAALAVIASVLSLWVFRLYRQEHLKIIGISLKQGHKTTRAGTIFKGIYAIILLFTVHSAFIRYNQLSGEYYYRKVSGIHSDAAAELKAAKVAEQVGLASLYLDRVYTYGFYRSAALLRQTASLAIYRQDHEKAIVYLQDMIKRTPDDLEARLRLAKLYVVKGREKEALEQLHVLSGIPANKNQEKQLKSEALVVLGHLEEKGHFASLALSRYQEAIDANPQNGEAWLAAGVLAAKSGDFEKAEHYLVKAAGLQPPSAIIENSLAFLCIQKKDGRGAQIHLEKLLQLQPENEQAAYNLAMIRSSMGRKKEAMTLLENLAVRHPENQKAAIALYKIKNEMQTAQVNTNHGKNSQE
ncbi:MAG: tetratricopeptide repeat protein [Bacteroidia bacterium]|nr:tetratricopeptide repeat protein [Bacteroidia bacterium]